MKALLAIGLLPVLTPQGDPRSEAPLALSPLISDGMVLQRGEIAVLKGTGRPGSAVVVVPGWGAGQRSARTEVRQDGTWTLPLDVPATVEQPTTLEFTLDGEAARTVTDVLVGEVFLCSGQSNMEWPLWDVIEAARASSGLGESTLGLGRRDIRYFKAPNTTSAVPLGADVQWPEAAWTEAHGQDALDCSAVAYFFACRLQDELGVPIGLVDAAVGGTPAEAWMPAETLWQFPRHAEAIAAMREAEAARGELSPADLGRDFLAAMARAGLPADPSGIAAAEWGEQSGRSHFEQGPVGAHDGAVWLTREVVLPPSMRGVELTLELPGIDDFDVTLCGGEVIGSTFASGSWNKPRRYVVPGSLTGAERLELAILCIDTGGPGGLHGKAPFRLSTGEEALGLDGPWRVAKGPAKAALPPLPAVDGLDRRMPTVLWNAMVAPLLPYTFRGIIWYQGESNRQHAEEYRTLFPALIVAWREALGEAWELPFHFVQIAPYDYGEGRDDDLGVLRMAQAGALELPATRMAVTCDIGNPRDIHPKNKWAVGDRLARFALHDLYGREDAQPFGPVAVSARRAGNELQVQLEHAGGGLTARGPLGHFEVAGPDGVFEAAEARIAGSGDGLILAAGGVTEPVRARYLWSDDAEGNVFGPSGLPLAPFVVEAAR